MLSKNNTTVVNLQMCRWRCGRGPEITLNEGNRSAPRSEKPSIPPLFAQSKSDMRGSRGRLTFSSFFSSSRKADTPRTIVWKGCRNIFNNFT